MVYDQENNFCVVYNNKVKTKLIGLQWQGAPSNDVFGEYRVRFSWGTTFDQCACLYV